MIVPVSFCHTNSYKNTVNCMMSTKCRNVNGKYHFLKVLFARYFVKRSQIIKCIQQGIKKKKKNEKKKKNNKRVYFTCTLSFIYEPEQEKTTK